MAEEAAPLPFGIRTTALTVLSAVAIVAALKAAQAILVPVLVSVLLAYALEPLVGGLVRLKVPRGVAAILVFGALLAGAQSFVRVAAARAGDFAARLPATVAAIRDEIASHGLNTPGVVEDARRAAGEIEQAAAAVAPPGPNGAVRVTVVRHPFNLATALVERGGTVLNAGISTLVVALLTFLLMATGDLYKRKLVKLGGSSLEARKVTVEVIKRIDRQIERYLVVRLAISAIVAMLTSLALWPIGVRHWIAWGIVAGVLNVLPFVGPSVAVAAIALAAFLQFHSAEPALLAGGLSTAVAMFEGNWLTPALTSRAGELNTVAVFVGVLFWGWTWDVWGLVLAVPILVAVKAAADQIEPLRPLGELLGE